MTFPIAMMNDSDSVWMNRQAYSEAEEYYQLFLNQNLTEQVTKSHAADPAPAPAPAVAVDMKSSPLINEIAKARDSIKQSLSGMAASPAHVAAGPDAAHVAKLEEENKAMKNLIEDLAKQVKALELRVGNLEGGSAPAPAAAAVAPKPAKADDSDSDFDMDDSDDEEETEADKKKKEELLRKYHEKKGKKPALVAKSSILLDVKPWDDETDMAEIERCVRTVVVDGMKWNAQSKLVPVGYGIRKLQIGCVVEDLKCGSEILEEEIMKFDELVQSVDIAAFNKI